MEQRYPTVGKVSEGGGRTDVQHCLLRGEFCASEDTAGRCGWCLGMRGYGWCEPI